MYHIGKQVPLDYPRKLIGEPLETPKWHALLVPSRREEWITKQLKRKGIHCKFPKKKVELIVRGKPHERKYPVISGLIYAKFKHSPQWDVLKNRRLMTGVISHNDRPIEIGDEDIRKIMGLPTREEQLRAERAERNRIREGDRAELDTGHHGVYMVDIRRVEGAHVWFETLTGVKGDTHVSKLSRKVD